RRCGPARRGSGAGAAPAAACPAAAPRAGPAGARCSGAPLPCREYRYAPRTDRDVRGEQSARPEASGHLFLLLALDHAPITIIPRLDRRVQGTMKLMAMGASNGRERLQVAHRMPGRVRLRWRGPGELPAE